MISGESAFGEQTCVTNQPRPKGALFSKLIPMVAGFAQNAPDVTGYEYLA